MEIPTIFPDRKHRVDQRTLAVGHASQQLKVRDRVLSDVLEIQKLKKMKPT